MRVENSKFGTAENEHTERARTQYISCTGAQRSGSDMALVSCVECEQCISSPEGCWSRQKPDSVNPGSSRWIVTMRHPPKDFSYKSQFTDSKKLYCPFSMTISLDSFFQLCGSWHDWMYLGFIIHAPSRHLNDLFIIPVLGDWLLNTVPKIIRRTKPNALIWELCWLLVLEQLSKHNVWSVFLVTGPQR